MVRLPTLRNMRPVQLGIGPQPSLGQRLMQPAVTSSAGMADIRNAVAQQGLQAGAMRQAQRPKSQAELLAAYGLGPRATVAAPTRKPSMSTAAAAERAGLSGMLPAAGTPEMAGLGAAGRTLMQLGGYQDQPYTLGQILGAGAEKGIEAMQARRDSIAAAEEKKAAAERQARIDRLNELKTLADLGKRNLKTVDGVGLVDVTDIENPEVVVPAKEKPVASKPVTPTSGKRTVEKDGVFYEEGYAQFPVGTPGTDNLGRVYSGVFKPVEKPEKPKTGYGFEAIKDGKWIGRAVEKDGVMYIRDSEGNETAVTDDVEIMDTESYKLGVNKKKDFEENKSEVENQLRARQKLEEYRKSRQGAREGVGLLADQFTTTMKTVFSEVLPKKWSKLTPSELSAAIAEGQLNGQIGSLRLQVVGGGVMTEQDALRVISYLGGNLSLLTNKQAVENAVQRVLSEKDGLIEELVEKHNKQVDYFYGRGGQFDKIEFTPLSRRFATGQRTEGADEVPSGDIDISVVPQGFPPSDWALLSDDDKREYIAAGQ